MYGSSVIFVLILCAIITVENYPTKDDNGIVSQEWEIIAETPHTRLDTPKTAYTTDDIESSGSGDGFSDDEDDDDSNRSGSGSKSIDISKYPVYHTTPSSYIPLTTTANSALDKTTENSIQSSGSGDGELDDDDDDDNEGSGSGVHLNIIDSPPVQQTSPPARKNTEIAASTEAVQQPSSTPSDFLFEDENEIWGTDEADKAISLNVDRLGYATTAPQETPTVTSESPNLTNKESRSNGKRRHKTFKLAHK